MLKSTTLSTAQPFNWLKALYLILALTGSIECWFWLLQDPAVLLSPTLFLQRAFANNVSTTIATDLLVSAIAFWGFVWIELKRLSVSRWEMILYVGLTLGIGLCCSLPFFLYRREQILERKS